MALRGEGLIGGREGGGGGSGQPSRDPAGVLDTQEGSPEHGRSVLENLVQLFQLQMKKKTWRVNGRGGATICTALLQEKAAFVSESLRVFFKTK